MKVEYLFAVVGLGQHAELAFLRLDLARRAANLRPPSGWSDAPAGIG